MPDDRSEAFVKMAALIQLNQSDGFAGAFVIVPPSGEPIAGLLLDPGADPGVFFGMLKTKIDIAVQQAEEEAAKSNQWNRR